MSTPTRNTPSTPEDIVADTVVYRTNDYGRFHFAEWNRDVTHAAKIEASIQTHGDLLRHFPILVSPRDEGGFYVFDGQGRLEAARRLGLPIDYIVTDLRREHVPVINSTTTKWGMAEYLNHYARQRYEDYLAAEAFRKAHPYISSNVLIETGQLGDTNNARKDFKAGSWCFDNEAALTAIADAARETRPYFAGWKDTLFHKSLRHALANPGYEHDWFVSRLESGVKMEKRTSVPDYLAEMTAVYRWRARGERAVFTIEEVYDNPRMKAALEAKRSMAEARRVGA